MQDPYKILGIDRKASQDEIKRAYRKLAKKYHPDINPGNDSVERQFKEISQAYSLLGDPDKRARFDRGEIDSSGQETPRWSGFYKHAEQPEGAKYAHFGEGAGFSAEDIFADLFGRARRTRGSTIRRRGADVSYRLPISFLEAATGTTKRVSLTGDRTIDVKIPPGTEDQQVLRLKGQGMSGVGGAPAGDALIQVQVEPHRFFRREGRDIHLDLPISLSEAVLGARVDVPTVHGKVAMRIPPGSNSGKVLRLKGKGVPARGDGVAGDQLVHLRVVLPEKPDPELQSFIEKWGQEHAYDPRRTEGLT